MALIETEGVNVIPESERTRGFWQIFTIWAGFSIVITNFLLGSLTVDAGLWVGIAAVAVSIFLVGIIVYLGTYIASEEGTAGTTAMRAAFGVNGRAIPALAQTETACRATTRCGRQPATVTLQPPVAPPTVALR